MLNIFKHQNKDKAFRVQDTCEIYIPKDRTPHGHISIQQRCPVQSQKYQLPYTVGMYM